MATIPDVSRRVPLALALLLLALGGIYVPRWSPAWLNWDDPKILADPILGLGPAEAVRTAFTTSWDRAWYPLTRLFFASLDDLDLLQPVAVHVADLALFAAATVGLVALLPRLGVPRSWVLPAATVWALHPLRVESVAWISSTKDVLSLSLAVGAAWCLVGQDGEHRGPRWAVAGHALWVGALLAKSAIFPVAGVLWAAVATQCGVRSATRRLGVVLALALADAATARWVFAAGTVPPWPDGVPAWALPAYSMGMWTAGVAVPTRLAAVYPIPASPWPWVALGVLAVVVPMGLAALHHRRSGRPASWALVGLWLLPVIPVTGLVPLAFWAADRYTLISSLAPAILAGGVLTQARRIHNRAPAVATILLGLGLAGASARRAADWHDNMSLWTADVSRPGTHFTRQANLGSALGGVERFDDALAAYRAAEALAPDRRDIRAHRLFAELVAGGWNEARARAGAALEPPPVTAPDWGLATLRLLEAGEPELAAEALATMRDVGAPARVLDELQEAVDRARR